MDVQTTDGVTTAQGLCREEWQAFCKYFLHPIMEKAVLDRLRAEADGGKTYACAGQQVTFAGLVEYWKTQLLAAYQGLRQGLWKTAPNVSMENYKPTLLPYFLSYDNCTAHSFWVNKGKQHLSRQEIPLSLLQLIRVAPCGHDMHQVVEHAIGVIKGHAHREMAKAGKEGVTLTSDMLFKAVQEGAKRFGPDSLDNNLVRLNHALNVISRELDDPYDFVYKGKTYRVFGTAGSYAPIALS